MIREQGYSVAEVAKSLGVATNLLYRWNWQQEQQPRDQDLSEAERTELQRLRKENKQLRMEREIIKISQGHVEANSLFAKEIK